jgi:ATP-binding cassette, subfamily B, bacterial
MNTFGAEANTSPTISPHEEHHLHVFDATDPLLPVRSPAGQEQVRVKKPENVIPPVMPLPSIVSSVDQRPAAVLRRTMVSPEREVPPADKLKKPELARPTERRTQVANERTVQTQAGVAASQQERAHVPAQTPQTGPKKRENLPRSLLRRRRVPVLQQISMVECGAACLAMVLSYYGRKTTISEVREQCGIGRDGLTALDIVKAARKYGARVRAVSLKENDFRFVALPAIVHWEFNHFIVVERWTPRYVEVVDPAAGRRCMTAQEFDEGFTGVVIMLEPGVQFSREKKVSQVSLDTYARSYIRQAPLALVQVLGASLLLQLLGLVFPLLSEIALNDLIPLKMNDALQLFGIGIILLVLAQLVTKMLRSLILLYLQTRVDVNMILNFLEHLLSLPQRFFLQRSTGDILARVSSHSVIRDTISNQLFSTLLDGSFVVIYIAILFSRSQLFTLIVLVIGALQVILLLSTGKPLSDLNRQELAAIGKSQGYMTETLAGMKTLKSAGVEQRALERWTNLFLEQMNISVRRVYITSLIDAAISTLGTSAPLLLLWVGTSQVIHGVMQPGTMLALNALGAAILQPLASLVLSTRQLQLLRSHMERLADVLEAEPEQDIQGVAQPPRLRGQIRLEQVHFHYDRHSPPILRDINLTIQPGQKVAIVGRTGSGKSTLSSLLLGLYAPSKGEILYDGIPLRTLNYQAVRSQFGVVMQEAAIFSGSIRENITLNDPSMSMERVIRAAQLAAIHEDIMQMPMEYETMVSEGGNALSGGQCQRLALARALANNPAILLLDEATSSLDVATEQVVERNIRQLACTQIISAHRLSTIRSADMILVLDAGQIVERGTHEALLRENGHYARLIQSQLVSGEVRA